MTDLTRRGILGVALATGATVVMSPAGLLAEGAVNITFVLVNDVYNMSEEKGRGGTARLAAIVKAERLRGGNVFFVHAGDTTSPSLMSGFDHGAHMIALFNAIRPDVFVPGNHEFDFGKDTYFQRMGEAKFPILAANLRLPDGSVLAGHKDTLSIEAGGVKLGFVGSTLDSTPQISSPDDLVFAPTLDTVRNAARALRAAGADLVVAVVHADKLTGQRLIESGAADLILSGHNHDLHIDYDGRVLLAESGEEAQFVTAIDIAVDVKTMGDKRIVSWWPNFRIIDSATIAADPDVLALVKHYEGQLSDELDIEIAILASPLDSRTGTVRGGEAAIGNLIADALRAATGADFAITNGGGIRAGKQYPAGTRLTRRDILSELPFGNRTVTTEITGAAVKAAIENGLSQLEQKGGRFPQVSGIKIVANTAAPAGSRVQSIEINGAPLDETRTYRVATNDFMLRGGDGYSSLGGKVKATADSGGSLMANDVMTLCRRLGTVDAKVEGRVVLN